VDGVQTDVNDGSKRLTCGLALDMVVVAWMIADGNWFDRGCGRVVAELGTTSSNESWQAQSNRPIAMSRHQLQWPAASQS
jgi:hypothetical protein